MMSELENLDSAWEMTVLPLPCQHADWDSDSPSESARDGSRTTLYTREQGVKHALAGQQGEVRLELGGRRPGCTDRPELHHRVLGRLAFKLGLEHNVLCGQ